MREHLNADVGEGAGYDAQLIPLVGSVNICCGAHAGGQTEMETAVSLALNHGAKIGAHPGYPDRENFGRKALELTLSELEKTLRSQLISLDQIVTAKGAQLSYIKPHGALYNQMATDYHFSCEVIEILQSWNALPIVALAHSAAVEAGQDLGLRMISEGFMDRHYTDEGTLVPRSDAKALITDPQEAAYQAEALLSGEEFYSVHGKPLRMKVDTICVHGDTEDALLFLKKLT